MGEDNGQNGEMAPPEDSVTVPLTDGGKQVSIDVTENADSEEDGKTLGANGLSKEELLQYANDPFWVRLRIFCMALFWVGWCVMLGAAIWIIVQAPRCEPPPSSTWLEQGALVQLDVSDASSNLTAISGGLGLASMYVPDLIDPADPNELNPAYEKTHITAVLAAISGAGIKVVTDFMALSSVDTTKLSAQNMTQKAALETVFLHWKDTYNVSGYLVGADRYAEAPPKWKNLTNALNLAMNPDVAFGGPLVDISDKMADLSDLTPFKTFMMDNSTGHDWVYYKVAVGRMLPAESVGPALVAQMLLPGTPLLEMTPSDDVDAFVAGHGMLTSELEKMRAKDAILYGETQYLNTSSALLAFTRTIKGTPGYAVVVNTEATSNATATVDFSGLDHVPKHGTLALQDAADLTHGAKVSMASVTVPPQSYVVVQFVAQYDE